MKFKKSIRDKIEAQIDDLADQAKDLVDRAPGLRDQVKDRLPDREELKDRRDELKDRLPTAKSSGTCCPTQAAARPAWRAVREAPRRRHRPPPRGASSPRRSAARSRRSRCSVWSPAPALRRSRRTPPGAATRRTPSYTQPRPAPAPAKPRTPAKRLPSARRHRAKKADRAKKAGGKEGPRRPRSAPYGGASALGRGFAASRSRLTISFADVSGVDIESSPVHEGSSRCAGNARIRLSRELATHACRSGSSRQPPSVRHVLATVRAHSLMSVVKGSGTEPVLDLVVVAMCFDEPEQRCVERQVSCAEPAAASCGEGRRSALKERQSQARRGRVDVQRPAGRQLPLLEDQCVQRSIRRTRPRRTTSSTCLARSISYALSMPPRYMEAGAAASILTMRPASSRSSTICSRSRQRWLPLGRLWRSPREASTTRSSGWNRSRSWERASSVDVHPS